MFDTIDFRDNKELSSPNRNIMPLGLDINEEGRLTFGKNQLNNLAKQYGTPLYIIDEETIRAACSSYKSALKKHYKGESLVLYASKANSSLAIGAIINSEKIGLDAVSEGEILTGLKSGIKGENIVLHGNNKSFNELKLAYKNNITIVIDNYNDILYLKSIATSDLPANIMLRFTPGIECHTHEYIKTGTIDSKFGFDFEEIDEILIKLKDLDYINLIGLHAHIGSQIFELKPHYDLAEIMAEVFLKAKNLGHDVKDLNVGGGLGVKYVSSDDPPTIDDWIQTIAQGLSNACLKRGLPLPRLLCEPGRSLIANAGVTIYQLGAKKYISNLKKTYISVDGGMSDNPRPITYQAEYSACLVDAPTLPGFQRFTVAGKHCESGDVLFSNLALPEFKIGDFLVVFGTGAYNYSMSSNYNRIPRPATVLVKNGISDLVQKRETPQDLLRNDIVPDRFIAK